MSPLCGLFIFMVRVIGMIILFGLFPFLGEAKFVYNHTCKRAHLALLQYELQKAKNLLSLEKKLNPDNLIPNYLTNYVDFYKMAAYEDPDVYDTLEEHIENRLRKLRNGPSNSPFYYFSRAEIQLHWALIQVKAGDWWYAGKDFYDAYQLLKTTKEKHPDFLPAKKSLLPVRAMIGTLPQSYQSLISIFGLKGSLLTSIEAYKDYLLKIDKRPKWEAYHQESQIFWAFMQYHLLNQEKEAWKTIKGATKDYASNPVSAFTRANIALNIHKNEKALKTLKPYKSTVPPIPHLDYFLGIALLQKLDHESRHYFGRYIRHFKGNSYVKDAYLKMGWAALINGNKTFYKKSKYMVKHKSQAIRSVDKQAMKKTDRYDQSNLYLLEARLLFDGGYYQKALKRFDQTLKWEGKTADNNPQFKEHFYRLGRIYQEMERDEKALKAFQHLKTKGFNSENYFKPAAYYQLGVIYEKKENYEKAISHFKRVLEYEDYPYENSFSQKAKAGIKRLKEK